MGTYLSECLSYNHKYTAPSLPVLSLNLIGVLLCSFFNPTNLAPLTTVSIGG
jgi:hypothetical protein